MAPLVPGWSGRRLLIGPAAAGGDSASRRAVMLAGVGACALNLAGGDSSSLPQNRSADPPATAGSHVPGTGTCGARPSLFSTLLRNAVQSAGTATWNGL